MIKTERMPALKKSTQRIDPRRALRIAIVLVVILGFSLLFSGVLTLLLHARMAGSESLIGAWVREEPHRFMRRLMTLLAVLGAPVLLKVAGWRGWRDCGVLPEGSVWNPGHALRESVTGVLLGLCTLTPLVALSVLSGQRAWSPHESAIWLAMGLVVLRSAIVGLFEEVVARGVLFRVLARAWTLWPAMLVSSALFAYLHFFKASPGVFSGDVSWWGVLEVIESSFRNVGLTEDVTIRFINLTLMSMVLCLMVARSGTIWMAAGTHAGWVFVKFSNRKLTVDNGAAVDALWIGHRSDATDGLLTTCILALLLVVWWGLMRRRNDGLAT